jgi:hypothetical protein
MFVEYNEKNRTLNTELARGHHRGTGRSVERQDRNLDSGFLSSHIQQYSVMDLRAHTASGRK